VIRLTFLGTGTPTSDAERAQTGHIIDIGDQRLLVDCGRGTVLRMLQAGIEPDSVTALLLTHLHSDHTLDYAAFVYAAWHRRHGGAYRLPVQGPSGTRQLTTDLFERAFAPDLQARLHHRGGERPTCDVAEHQEGGVWLRTPGCTVTSFPVVHFAPTETFALRFEDGEGHVLVLSSDTTYHEPLAGFARDADVLIHEAFLYGPGFERQSPARREALARGHATPEEAAAIARAAGARHLVLTHLSNGVDPQDLARRAGTAAGYDGPVTVARDGMVLTVPEG
jgi:ribonuclease Z